MKTNKSLKQGGFGLAEVLLASGVLILVVASIVALSRFVIRGYALTASRTQALYLAQESLEVVRQIRDSYWIDTDPSTDFRRFSDGDYYARWAPAGGNQGVSRFELRPGPETLSLGSSPTTFTRTITIATVSGIDASLDPHMKRVTARVEWAEGGRTWSVTTETYLTDWRLEG